MKKIFMFLILIGIVIGFFAGLNKSGQTSNQLEEENEQADVNEYIDEITLPILETETLNPLRTSNSHVKYILQLIYEPLFGFDEKNQLNPIIADLWMKKDELTWIIRIKDNIYWHNGEKLTIADVVNTINLLINGGIDSVYNSNIQNILKVEATSEKDITIYLKEPEPYLTSKLVFPILPSKYNSKENEDISVIPGSGPYKYSQKTNDGILLIANENWWKDNYFKLKKINLKKYPSYYEAMRAFKLSEIDMIFTNMHDWKEKFGFIGINSYKFESMEYELLIPNTENQIMSDPAVKNALVYAINRANIVSTIYDDNAIIADLPIASNSKYYEISSEYDKDMANQILSNGGWKKENNQWKKNGKILSFSILVSSDDKDKLAVAEKIKSDLSELNIKVTLKKVSDLEFSNLIENNKFEMALASFEIKNEYQIQDLVEIGNKHNYANYINMDMDNIIKQLKTLEGEAYDSKFDEFKNLYRSEMPYVGLYFKANTILTNKSVKGEYKSTATEPFRNIKSFCK